MIRFVVVVFVTILSWTSMAGIYMPLASFPALNKEIQAYLPTCTPDICVINQNYGGDLDVFLTVKVLMVAAHGIMVVNGECDSACTVLADQLRPNGVCITPKAYFGFHLGEYLVAGRIVGTFVPTYSNDLIGYIKARGGLALDPKKILYMPWPLTKMYWKTCDGT